MAEQGYIQLSRIRIDGGTQTRAAINADVVAEYAATMELGTELPEVVVFDDGKNLWMADGFHRYFANLQLDRKKMPAKVKNGTVRDALLYSAGCNDSHGLRRSNEDKREAVKLLLSDPEWANSSDSWIAEKCRVSDHLVKSVRQNGSAKSDDSGSNSRTSTGQSTDNNSQNGSAKRTGKDGKKYDANKPLCNRCKKDGPVKNCSACQDLRRTSGAKKRKKKEPKTPQATEAKTDDFKREIPQRCLDAWCDPWIQRTYDCLTEISEKFRMEFVPDGMRKRAKHYPFFNAKDVQDGAGFIIQYLDGLLLHLKNYRPSAVCRECDGEGCSTCRRSGLVPRHVYLGEKPQETL